MYVTIASATDRCPPDFSGTPPNCRATPYLPVKYVPCPAGQVGSPPNCHTPCPSFTRGTYPDCHRIACPAGSIGEYQPDCRFQTCEHGLVGRYPDCHPRIYIPYVGCPAGQIGSYPDNCYVPCPAYTFGRPPNCTRIRCPKGWEGEFQPDCHFTPKCPDDKPGVWPNCWSMYCPPDSIGVYPGCKCRVGLVGEPGSCKPENATKMTTTTTTTTTTTASPTPTPKVPPVNNNQTGYEYTPPAIRFDDKSVDGKTKLKFITPVATVLPPKHPNSLR